MLYKHGVRTYVNLMVKQKNGLWKLYIMIDEHLFCVWKKKKTHIDWDELMNSLTWLFYSYFEGNH